MNIGPIIVIGIATLVIVLVLVMLNEAAVKKLAAKLHAKDAKKVQRIKKGGKRKTPFVQIVVNRK